MATAHHTRPVVPSGIFPPSSSLSKDSVSTHVVPASPSPPSSSLPSPDLSTLSLHDSPSFPEKRLPKESKTKRVGVVGAGTAGIGVLLALLDLPEKVREKWTIEVLEKREGLGGVWLPDEADHTDGSLPETPLYPALHTNTIIPTMTFPSSPFPPTTPLFPSHVHIRSYLESVISSRSLSSYLHYNQSVETASWSGDATSGKWVVQIAHPAEEEGKEGWTEVKEYHHLVVATGRYHHPNIPTFKGQEAWLPSPSADETRIGRQDREIIHSLGYRGPEQYAGRTVIVVGFGASGWDIATQTNGVADKVYHSYTDDPNAAVRLPAVPGTIAKPRISHLTPSAIHFVDGTVLPTPPSSRVSIILATGYKLAIPFLTPQVIHQGPFTPNLPAASEELRTNGTYLRPLHQNLLSLDARLPANALAVVGLPWYAAAAAQSYVQGLYLAHSFANEEPETLFPEETREGALRVLEEDEAERRKKDEEPFKVGHKFTTLAGAETYQDSLLSILHQRSHIPLPPAFSSPSTPYVSPWRRWGRANTVRLKTAFLAAVEEGIERTFTVEEGREGTEEEWVEVMERLSGWWAEREAEAARETEQESLVVLGPTVGEKEKVEGIEV